MIVLEKEATAAAGVGAVGSSPLLEEASSQLSHKRIQLFNHLPFSLGKSVKVNGRAEY